MDAVVLEISDDVVDSSFGLTENNDPRAVVVLGEDVQKSSIKWV